MSVVKVLLLAAYLDRPGVRDAPLDAGQRRALRGMIRGSHNSPANRLHALLGVDGLRQAARRAGMRRFVAMPYWAASRLDAADASRLFLGLERLLPARHRAWAIDLLEGVWPEHRWGVARAAPEGWRIAFKGGWGDGPGRAEHQAALLRRGSLRVAVAVMSEGKAGDASGRATLRGVFARLLRGLENVRPADD